MFDPNIEMSEKVYVMPDGLEITLYNERYQSPELLFKPELADLRIDTGISELLYKQVINCPIDLRKSMFNNIILSGGNTKLEGFTDRMKTDL